MSHAFQHRPPPPDRELFLEQAWAHGFRYIARQSKLRFGHDRGEPVEWRYVVSIRRDGDTYLVAPGTKKSNRDFFRLTAQDFLSKKARPDAGDSYLCHRVEGVNHADLRERGVLHHPVRIRLMQWLKEKLLTPPSELPRK
ncbi:MAG TPA: hypothetical protein DEP36_15925 [Gammaproteobacteria bacterium]|nr:hypothetical protein [Gammaproteobacteria bacterium]